MILVLASFKNIFSRDDLEQIKNKSKTKIRVEPMESSFSSF